SLDASSLPPAPRVAAHHLDPASSDLDRDSRVFKENRACLQDRARVARTRERVPRRLDVVVAEHRVDPVPGSQPSHRFAECTLAARPRDEIARQRDEIYLPLRRPADRLLERPAVPGDSAQMEVREMEE